MDAEHVVSVILGSDSESDWCESDEEREDVLEEESFWMDRLVMEQSKMAATCGDVNSLEILYKAVEMVKKTMTTAWATEGLRMMATKMKTMILRMATLDLRV